VSISWRVVRRFYDTNNGETMFRSLAIAALVMTASAVQAQQPAPRVKPVRTGYVPANGVNYYYEIYGRGAPLLILHGGLGSIEMFGQILPALAKGRQIIAVDLLGHGRTALGDRPINPQAMGDDLAAVVKRNWLEEWAVDCLLGRVSAGHVEVRRHRAGSRDPLPAVFVGAFSTDGDKVILAGHFRHSTASRFLLLWALAFFAILFTASTVFGVALVTSTWPYAGKVAAGSLSVHS